MVEGFFGAMMEKEFLHDWDVDYRTAVRIQEELRKSISLKNSGPRKVGIIAGADISYDRGDDLFHAAVVLLRFPSMERLEESTVSDRVRFPYIPGLLTFREGPVLLRAFAGLTARPDVALFDGQGIAHPRGLGLASHLGLLLDIPSVGCAKKRLFGEYGPVGENAGDFSPLVHDRKIIGAAVRTKKKTKPVFISPGHRISHKQAVEIALSSCRGYRIAEPIRQAHLLVNRIRKENTSRV
ncbi:MAG: deoxyribonuclease V [Syntrophales bacterium]|nr:deoxyribonuclease V [Syntrophales bacterium]